MPKKEKKRVVWETVKYMAKIGWKKKPYIYLLFLMVTIATLLEKAQVILLPKFLFDELAFLLEGEAIQTHLHNALVYVLISLGMLLVSRLLQAAVRHVGAVAEEWFNEYFEAELASRTMRMKFEDTENPEELDRLNHAKNGINWYSGGVKGILYAVYELVLGVTVLAGVGTIIFTTCPILIPIQLIALLVIAILNKKNIGIEVESYERLSGLNRIFSYCLYQIPSFEYGKEVRLYDSEPMMMDRSTTFGNDCCGVLLDCEKKKCRNSWYMDVVNAIRDGFSYFYIGLLAIRKVISVGDFSMCVASASELYQTVFSMVNGYQDLVKRCNYAYKYIEFMKDYDSETIEANEGDSEGYVCGDEHHEIEFDHVSFRYPRSEEYVLRDVSIKIRSGEHLSIVGLNGAGKTTFVKLLCRLYKVTEGVIRIDGKDIQEYSEAEYRKLFAVVFQDFRLFAFSLRENVELNHKPNEELLQEVLRLSGLEEDAKALPEGADTLIYKSFDEKGVELSGGQQQKAAISRALYRNAPIVILDEPTAALDPIAEYEIYQSFDQLVGGKTAIYISHRLSSCKFCDKIAVFSEGTIKEYGNHEELLSHTDGIYAEMFSTQAQYYVDQAS